MEVRDIIPSMSKPQIAIAKPGYSGFKNILSKRTSERLANAGRSGWFQIKETSVQKENRMTKDVIRPKGSGEKVVSSNRTKQRKEAVHSEYERDNPLKNKKIKAADTEYSEVEQGQVSCQEATMDRLDAPEEKAAGSGMETPDELLLVNGGFSTETIAETISDTSSKTGKIVVSPRTEGTDFVVGGGKESVNADEVLQCLADSRQMTGPGMPMVQDVKSSVEPCATEGVDDLFLETPSESIVQDVLTEQKPVADPSGETVADEFDFETTLLKEKARMSSETENEGNADGSHPEKRQDSAKGKSDASGMVGIGSQKSEAVRNHEAMVSKVDRSVMKQVVQKVTANVKVLQGGKALEIKLTPEHLGKVMMKLEMNKGELSASIKVENSEVKASLEASLAELREALNAKGVSIKEINVSVSKDGHRGGQEYSGRNQDSRHDEEDQVFDINLGRKDAEFVNDTGFVSQG